MTTTTNSRRWIRTRWAAIGAATAVSIGAVGLADAAGGGTSGATYEAITPCRLVDTRTTSLVGTRATPLGPKESVELAARGTQGLCTSSDLPATATALALNVTAVRASEQTFLTFWPEGTRPEASSLNPAPGAPPTPNAVIAALSATGSFKVYNERGNVGLIIDVVGYFTGLGDDLVTDIELTTELDSLLEALVGQNGPVKINTRDIAENRALLESKRTIEINRQAFRPRTSDVGYAVDRGAYVSSGPSDAVLVAPVEIPSGAQVTGVRAVVLDRTSGASIIVELVEVGPSGGSTVVSESMSTANLTPTSQSTRSLTGQALFKNSDPLATYEVVARNGQGVTWNDATVRDDLQIVSFVVEYTLEVPSL